MRRRRRDSMEVQQMKAQAKEEKARNLVMANHCWNYRNAV